MLQLSRSATVCCTARIWQLCTQSNRRLCWLDAHRVPLRTVHCACADGRTTALRAQVDRLEEEKADITLVTQYTGQVGMWLQLLR